MLKLNKLTSKQKHFLFQTVKIEKYTKDMKTNKQRIIFSIILIIIISLSACHTSRRGIVPCPSFGKMEQSVYKK